MPLFFKPATNVAKLAKASELIIPAINYAKLRAEKPESCSVVVAAAGSSERMEGEDKLFTLIDSAPVLAHTLMAFQNCKIVKEIIVVAREERIDMVSGICGKYHISKAVKIMIGGPTRLESVLRGVLAVSDKASIIAIHDGARPCIEQDVILRTFKTATDHYAAAPALNVTSTIKRVKNGIVTETVDRSELSEIQTPQIFTSELIKAALTNALNKSVSVTDDCMAVELLGVPIHVTEGSRNNIKITTIDDIAIAGAILQKRKSQVAASK